jgi:hypothetical protein
MKKEFRTTGLKKGNKVLVWGYEDNEYKLLEGKIIKSRSWQSTNYIKKFVGYKENGKQSRTEYLVKLLDGNYVWRERVEKI